MKKIIIFAMIIAIVLIVSGCGQEQPNNGGTTYLGGSQGVKINYAIDAPPDKVVDGGEQQFDIIVEMQNMGEDDVGVGEAEITISGFPPEPFSTTIDGLKIKNTEVIDKRFKTQDVAIEPVMIEAIFSNLNYKYKEPGDRTFPVRAEICYLYETNVATDLCIKEKMTQTNENDLCQVNSVRSISSSGAPIQITNLRQLGGGADKTRFIFTIANVDIGAAFSKDSLCEPSTAVQNKVWVQIEGLKERGGGASAVSCSGLQGGAEDSGTVTLSGGLPKDISCTVTIPESARNDRIQPFNINLQYKYQEFITKDLVVEYIPEE